MLEWWKLLGVPDGKARLVSSTKHLKPLRKLAITRQCEQSDQRQVVHREEKDFVWAHCAREVSISLEETHCRHGGSGAVSPCKGRQDGSRVQLSRDTDQEWCPRRPLMVPSLARRKTAGAGPNGEIRKCSIRWGQSDEQIEKSPMKVPNREDYLLQTYSELAHNLRQRKSTMASNRSEIIVK